MPPLDQYMLARTRELTEKILGWYEDFEFHRIYHALNEFAVAELSALYIDASKTGSTPSRRRIPARRSAQTVLWMIAEALVRLVAPMLSFTADEIWQYMPAMANRLPSVHLELFPEPASLAPDIDADFMNDWAALLAIRDEALKSLEEARKAKQIGKALDARLVLEVPREHGCPAGALSWQFEGAVERLPGGSGDGAGDRGQRDHPAGSMGTKCERCWNYSVLTGEDRRWPTVCERCSAALEQMGVPPEEDA